MKIAKKAADAAAAIVAAKKARKPSAYNLFMSHTMKRLREETPGQTAPSYMKEAIALWHADKEAAIASVQEEVDSLIEQQSQQFEQQKAETKTKTKRLTKRPPTAYNIFIGENITRLRKENADTNHKDLMRLAVTLWHAEKAAAADAADTVAMAT